MPIDAREQARAVRRYLDELDEMCRTDGAARRRGLTKADTERARRLVTTARTHLTSLEIATGLRPVGAALADERSNR